MLREADAVARHDRRLPWSIRGSPESADTVTEILSDSGIRHLARDRALDLPRNVIVFAPGHEPEAETVHRYLRPELPVEEVADLPMDVAVIASASLPEHDDDVVAAAGAGECPSP